jgi:L-cystine uptake protein TcyP (sodium:dicarboxylate symporter family)
VGKKYKEQRLSVKLILGILLGIALGLLTNLISGFISTQADPNRRLKWSAFVGLINYGVLP